MVKRKLLTGKLKKIKKSYGWYYDGQKIISAG